jgi:hypothetical protein
LIDAADGFVLAGDDAARVGAVLAQACALPGGLAGGYHVRDLADGAVRRIDALSDAGRIAAALAALAETQRARPVADKPVDPALVRRLLRLRRDRDRWLPAEIFADPAWDMLLDLLAAQLEGKRVPVSSLCIAAAVPTTTALRWVRGLTEAGLFERRVDPDDARRAHISLSPDAAAGVLGWLRAFSDSFAPR